MEIRHVQSHRTPGRLRVRSADLKGNPRHAQHAQSRLAEMDGVHSVDLNPLTGSLLIHFDHHRSDHDRLLQAVLSSTPSHSSLPTIPLPTTSVRTSSGPAYKVARIVLVYASEKLLEHAALSLIAAVL